MDTLSLRIRHRPIRIGWCIRKGNLDAFRSAARISFALWGGAYSPIIPVDDFELARSLVDLFRVDVLRALHADKTVNDFAAAFPHLPNPFFEEEVFVDHGGGKKVSEVLDIYHPLRRAYEDHFHNITKPGISVKIRRWELDEPLADVLLATLGELPSAEETGIDYLGLMRSDLAATDGPISKDAVLPVAKDGEWSVSSFSRAYLDTRYLATASWHRPGFYVGSANDFDDLVAFWNLRAANIRLQFFDPSYASRLEDRRQNWLERIRSRPEEREHNEARVSVWYLDGRARPDLGKFGVGLVLNQLGDATWNGMNVTVPQVHFAEGHALATIFLRDG